MIITIVSFVVVLSLAIFVHEMGHFFTARKFGVKVEEFGFGYPPRIFAIKKKETEYSLNWIPFGGFVKLKGLEDTKSNDKDSFTQKNVWQRVIILSAGVLMNIVMAFVLLSIGFMIGLPSVVDDSVTGNIKSEQIQVYEVLEGSPAANAEIDTGDVIVSIDNQTFNTVEDLKTYNQDKAGQEVSLKIKRGDETLSKTLSLQILDDSNEAKLGVSLIKTGIVSYPPHVAVVNGVKATGYFIWGTINGFYDLIKTAVVSQKLSADIAGPVGIAVISGQMARLGFIYLLQFVAVLSVALAIINFLPFPALDGGRVLFILIEKIRGKPVNQRIENIIHSLGFYLLIILLVMVSFRDIKRFEIGSSIVNLFKGIF